MIIMCCLAVSNLQSVFTHMFSFDPREALLLRRRGDKEPAPGHPDCGAASGAGGREGGGVRVQIGGKGCVAPN